MFDVTLTFDNGPHPEVTGTVLDVLAKHDVKTTFFLVGNQVASARSSAERALGEGHWIGNHTWSHSVPFRDKADDAFVREEILKTQDEIGTLAHPRRFFRPYGGQGRIDGCLTANAVDLLVEGGFTCVMWNSVPGDFKDHDGWVETALEQIEAIEQVPGKSWPLVVLHDNRVQPMRHLDRFIGTLKDRGARFRQEIPPDCVAIERGCPTALIDSGIVRR